MIKALFFAELAEQAGLNTIQLEFEPDLTARKLIDGMVDMVGIEAIATLRHDVVMLSINKQIADWDQPLNDGDEVGFMPPFSGG